MALTVSLLTQIDVGWDNGASGVDPLVSPTFTPGTNCLIAVIVTFISDQFGDPIAAANLTGGGATWTSIIDGGGGPSNTGQYIPTSSAWYTQVDGTALNGGSAFALTLNYNVAFECNVLLTVYKVVGHDTITPIGGKASLDNGAGNGALSLTLDAAPGSTDVTFAQSLADENTAGQSGIFGTGTWTTVIDGTTNPTHSHAISSGYRTGSTSTTVPWTDVNTGGDNFGSTLIAFVVKDGSGPPPAVGVPTIVISRVAVQRASRW